MPVVSVFSSQSQPTKLLYDRRSAAFALSISIRSLDYLIARKHLNATRLGKKIMLGHGELARFSRANHIYLTGVTVSDQ